MRPEMSDKCRRYVADPNIECFRASRCDAIDYREKIFRLYRCRCNGVVRKILNLSVIYRLVWFAYYIQDLTLAGAVGGLNLLFPHRLVSDSCCSCFFLIQPHVKSAIFSLYLGTREKPINCHREISWFLGSRLDIFLDGVKFIKKNIDGVTMGCRFSLKISMGLRWGYKISRKNIVMLMWVCSQGMSLITVGSSNLEQTLTRPTKLT